MRKAMLTVSVLLMGVLGVGMLGASEENQEQSLRLSSAGEEAVAERQQETLDASRALELFVHEPTLTGQQVRSLLRKSRHYQAVQPLSSGESFEGDDEGSGRAGEALRSALRHAPVSQEEEVAYFNGHRDLFGDRSFEQSRHTIQRLIRIEKLQESLVL